MSRTKTPASPEERVLRARMQEPITARAYASAWARVGQESSHWLLRDLKAEEIENLVSGRKIKWLADLYSMLDVDEDYNTVGDLEDAGRYLFQDAVVHPRDIHVNTERGWISFREQSQAQGDLLVGVKFRTVFLSSIFSVR